MRLQRQHFQEPSQPAPVGPAASGIDWTKAAQLAITEQLKMDDEARRRAEGFSRRSGMGPGESAEPAPQPRFGWAQWRVHRVQALEEGGLVVRLNERCALFVSVLLIPVCKVGKIEPRGDLFEHMDDPPAAGDWKK